MAIEGIGWPATPRIGKRIANRGNGAFAVSTDKTADAPSATSGPAEPACLGAFLSLQELGDQTVEDREARRHGQHMLDLLAALQRSLLNGVDNVAALQQLAGLSSAVPKATDRRLAAMISAIVLRARVELARRDM
jgi:class II flagellar assembly regulator FliX